MAAPPRGATVQAEASTTFVLLRRWQEYLEVSGRCNANTRRQYRRTLIAFLRGRDGRGGRRD